MKINYVTGNPGKVKLAQMIFKDMDVEISACDMETPEVQDLDCKVVAAESAKYAAEKLGKPVLKNDSGLFITALNGFPGALAKYTEQTIKRDGYIRLMEGIENRECYWAEALAYAEPGMEPVVFESLSYGTIALSPRGNRGDEFDHIFIPKGDARTFAEMSVEEQLKCFDDKAYIELYNYLSQSKKEL